jgi:hypothetical protein
MVLSVGILCAYPGRGFITVLTGDSAGGLLARRLLPAAILIPILLGWLRWQGERLGLYDTAFGVSVFAMSNIVVFSILITWLARSLHGIDVERRQAVQELRRPMKR